MDDAAALGGKRILLLEDDTLQHRIVGCGDIDIIFRVEPAPVGAPLEFQCAALITAVVGGAKPPAG